MATDFELAEEVKNRIKTYRSKLRNSDVMISWDGEREKQIQSTAIRPAICDFRSSVEQEPKIGDKRTVARILSIVKDFDELGSNILDERGQPTYV